MVVLGRKKLRKAYYKLLKVVMKLVINFYKTYVTFAILELVNYAFIRFLNLNIN